MAVEEYPGQWADEILGRTTFEHVPLHMPPDGRIMRAIVVERYGTNEHGNEFIRVRMEPGTSTSWWTRCR